MKRPFLISMTLIMFAMLSLVSCNEAYDDSKDKELSSQLRGTWVLDESQQNENNETVLARNVVFNFTNSNFKVAYSRTTISKTSGYSVTGSWRINRQVLELRYDLASLQTTGMTSEEENILLSSLKSNNLLLDDLKDTNQSYGMPIEISRTSSTEGYMHLSGSYDFAGIYELSMGGDLPQ